MSNTDFAYLREAQAYKRGRLEAQRELLEELHAYFRQRGDDSSTHQPWRAGFVCAADYLAARNRELGALTPNQPRNAPPSGAGE